MYLAKSVSNYSKRAKVAETDSFRATTYTRDTKKLLAAVKDTELLGFRCSDSFIRNNQGVYVFENKRANYNHTSRIKNNSFIEFMRNKEREIAKGKKILSGKVCETEKGTILLFYSIGEYDVKIADSASIRNVIAYSTSNSAYIQIIPDSFLARMDTFTIGKSTDHLRCDQPFLINKKNVLYILCEEKKPWQTTYLVYLVNLENKEFTVLKKCINRFKDKLETICG